MTETSPGASGGGSPTRACRKCEEVKPLEDFKKDKRRPGGFGSWCKSCMNAQNSARAKADPAAHAARVRSQRLKNPVSRMLGAARERAKQQGLPFDLKPEDIVIPTHCPALGIPLVPSEGRAGPASPSLDKIIPALGYVSGNVRVVSNRCNVLKRDATLEELEALVDFYSRLIAPASTSRRKANLT